jgi:spore germination protein GerM
VLVYFSRNPVSFNDPTAVFSVQRVAPTSAVATYAIQLLIAGPTLDERSAGYFSELNSLFTGPSACSNGSNPTGGPDFTLTLNKKGSSTEQGTATLQFCRPTSSPGIGADARITAEIHKTLTQFSTITKVVILLRNGHCFGDASGMDRCLT